MQLAKVVITSVLVLAACTEGLPEGKSCVLKYVKLFHTTQEPYMTSRSHNCIHVQYIKPTNKGLYN